MPLTQTIEGCGAGSTAARYKQIKTLDRFGQNIPGINRGDASLLITKIIQERGTR
jgi:hypothetical protein